MKALILDYGGVIALRKPGEFIPIFPDFELWDKAARGEVPEDLLWNKVSEFTGKTKNELLNILFQERELNQPVFDFLKRNKHKFRLGIINNGLYSMLGKAIEEWKLDELFDVIINSAREKLSKPDPKIFLLACERLKVPPKECVFIDDKEKHVNTAICLGMKGFVYTDFFSFKNRIEKYLVD